MPIVFTATQSRHSKRLNKSERHTKSQFNRRKEKLLKVAASLGNFFQCDVGLVVISPKDEYTLYCNSQLDGFLTKINKYLSENISPNLFCGKRPSHKHKKSKKKTAKKEKRAEPPAKRVKKREINENDYPHYSIPTKIATDRKLSSEDVFGTAYDNAYPTRNITREFNEIEKNAKKAALNELFSGCDTTGESFINKAKELARDKIPIQAKSRDKKTKYQLLNEEVMKINASGSYTDASFKISSLLSSSTTKLNSNNNGNATNNNNGNVHNNNILNNNESINKLPPLQAQLQNNEIRNVVFHQQSSKNTINFKNVFGSVQPAPSQGDSDYLGLPRILDTQDTNTRQLPPFSEIISNLKD